MRKKWIVLLILFFIICAFGSYYCVVPFSLIVVPKIFSDVGIGQMCVFLVSVDHGFGKVKISSSLSPAPQFLNKTPSIVPSEIVTGEVAEIIVYPFTFGNVTLAIAGERFGLRKSEEITFSVLDLVVGNGELSDLAEKIQKKFIRWLDEYRPYFNITEETKWIGTVVKPRFLIVTHYLFFSEEREMCLTWHVTIEPHNWARIYLRRRFVEITPSKAFQLSSWTSKNYIIQEISLEDAFAEEVWR